MKFSPEHLGLLTDEVKKGVGSETLLRVLGPTYDARLEALLIALDQAAPSLELLLDLRAKISVLRSLKRELSDAIRAGQEASEKISR
jgi:hypothetical protein